MTKSKEPLFGRPIRNYDLEMDNNDASRSSPAVVFFDNSDDSYGEVYMGASGTFYMRTTKTGGELRLISDDGNIALSTKTDGSVYPNGVSTRLGTSALPFEALYLGEFVDMNEITTPATPANGGRTYVKDNGTGSTGLYFLDDSGTETDLLAGATGVPSGALQFVEAFAESVATGEQHKELTLTKGTTRAVKRVDFYCAGAAADMFYSVAYGTTGSHTDVVLKGYYNSTPYIDIDENTFQWDNSDKLVVSINTGSGDTETVYITVKYYYQ